MLLSNFAKVKWNNKNRKYYESLGYVFTKNGDSFEVPIEQLTKSSKAIVEVLCDFCKKTVVEKTYQTYVRQHHPTYGDCCHDCQPEKNKLCCLDKYGVDNGSKTPDAIQKIKETSMKKYGVDNPSKSKQVREKISVKSKENAPETYKKYVKTMMEKYGTFNPMYVPEIKEKQRETFYENYGVYHPKQNEEVKARERQHNFEKYGYENVLQIPEIKEKIRATCLERYGAEYTLSLDEVREKIYQAYLKNGTIPTSKPQEDLFNLLHDKYDSCELNYRCGRYILDCKLEVNGIAIDVEYDGRYWHQDQERDDRRDEYMFSQGYKVLRVIGDHDIPSFEQLQKSVDKLTTTDTMIERIEMV